MKIQKLNFIIILSILLSKNINTNTINLDYNKNYISSGELLFRKTLSLLYYLSGSFYLGTSILTIPENKLEQTINNLLTARALFYASSQIAKSKNPYIIKKTKKELIFDMMDKLLITYGAGIYINNNAEANLSRIKRLINNKMNLKYCDKYSLFSQTVLLSGTLYAAYKSLAKNFRNLAKI